MATNVYAPESHDLSGFGFRWCKKDCRWESRKTIPDAEAMTLAAELKYQVVVKGKDYVFSAKPPEE